MRFPVLTWASAASKKPTLPILIACLLLVAYIGFLMISNYRSQIALRESTLNRFRLDVEKRAAALEYFFTERKYDLRAMAASREITAYFVDKSLGMSEEYGLKVSLFVIGQMLKKAMAGRSIQGDQIYERFVFLDPAGRPLVDTRRPRAQPQGRAWQNLLTPQQRDPSIVVEAAAVRNHILLVAPCFHKEEFAGELVAWLNVKTLLAHFVDLSIHYANKGFELTTEDGRLIHPPQKDEDCFGAKLTRERIMALAEESFSSLKFYDDTRNVQQMLVSRWPIHSTPLNLLAWVPTREIFGSLPPWQLFIGTGSLAIVILIGIGVLIRFSTQNLILKARFDESERQQALLFSKNRQLKKEIKKRRQAEKELKEQRTLRMRSDRLRSLGEMAAGISHELNQPLVGVRGMAELILLGTENGQKITREELRKKVAQIVEQSDRMVHIINHVRLFAREAGNTETSRVDLNDVIHSGISLILAQFKSHGLSLEQELSSELPPVQINPFSVEEVLLNLLSNARDAVEYRKLAEGPDYIPCVRVCTCYYNKNSENTVRLAVEDNGSGIAGSLAGKIFDPFFTTKDPDKGTGLGLSICKSIVEGFGGQIFCESTEGVGTVFFVDFPACSCVKVDSDD